MIYTSPEFKKRWSKPNSWNISKNKNLDITIFLSELIYELFNISVELVYFLFIFATKKNIIYLKKISYDYLIVKDVNFNKLNKKTIIQYNTKSIITTNNFITSNSFNKQIKRDNCNKKNISKINDFSNFRKLNKNVAIEKDCNIIISSCFTPPESSLNYLWKSSKFIDNLDDIDNTGSKYFEYDNYHIDKNIKEHFLNNVYYYLKKNNVMSDNNVMNSNIIKETIMNNSCIDTNTINENHDIDMIFKLDEEICGYYTDQHLK